VVTTGLLAVDGLDVGYGRVPVVTGLSCRVGRGEVVALLGTNGAGKSTVVRAVAGLLAPSAGSVRFEGADLGRMPPDRRARLGIATVLGGSATFASLTVEESLRVGAAGPRDLLAGAVEAVLDRFPLLAARRRSRAGTLSAGEQQLLALARASIGSPRLLLVDELTLGLSPLAAESVLGAVAEVAATGVGVLLVEQSPERAAAVAERAYFLERGQVRFDGPVADLLDRRDLLRPVLLAGVEP